MEAPNAFAIAMFQWEQFSRQSHWLLAPKEEEGSNNPQEHDRLPEGITLVTQDVWDSLPWNPMLGYSFVDPDAGPKPAWGDVVDRYKTFAVATFGHWITPGLAAAEHVMSHKASLLADTENAGVVNAAHQSVIPSFEQQSQILHDATSSPASRYDAGSEMEALAKAYPAAMQVEIARLKAAQQ